MINVEKYYDNTKSNIPNNNVKYFVENIQSNAQNAIELGCGAGNDTVYLIKNNWNVLAIDREDVEERITSRLNEEELKKFTFQKQEFETIKLRNTNLIVANFSLPFCIKDKFFEMWEEIDNSILPNRIFCWKLFWSK